MTVLKDDRLLSLYQQMVLIRKFEELVATLYRDGTIPGFVHVSIGQEATAVGVCSTLRDDDIITSTHRGHGHCLAKGMSPTAMLAELLGRSTGSCKGRGGSMHIADPRMGIFGANGIVGAGAPIAVGAATAAQLRRSGQVVVSFFGDGAVAQGAFHEALNLAALWRLPVLFLCENNGYAEFTPTGRQHPVSLETRAAGYGVPFERMDGNDVEQMALRTAAIVNLIRDGSGPFMVEAETYRWHGHYEGDPARYRPSGELAERRERDPLVVARQHLVTRGLIAADLDELERKVGEALSEALDLAQAAPEPDPVSLGKFVVVDRQQSADRPPQDAEGECKLFQAVHDALEHELEDDHQVFLAGVDVGAGGNVFGITRGLHARWPDRVRDTPISESAVMGLAVGAAMAGLRPIVELMYLDFLGVCFDQLLNQAAKMRYMTGGQAELPLTVRTQFGAGNSAGSQHSQSLEVLVAHIPGLTVAMPSTPSDAYGLLRAAIQDPNPVIVIEHRGLYGMRGPRPERGHTVPIGKAALVREGRHVTVVSISRMVHEAVAAADVLAGEGIDVEVVDLRTLVPLDRQMIAASVAKTGRLVIAHEAVGQYGFGGEIAALAAGDLFWSLDAPIVRVAAPETPVPYARSLEQAWLPGRKNLVAAIRRLALC